MKRTLTTFTLLLITFSIHAQIPGFNIGPKIGYNTRKFSTDLSAIKSDPDGAFQFGAFARIGKKIYIQPEVNYVIKGGKVTFDGSENATVKIKTITMPVLLGYRVIDAKVFNIRFMAGPAFSFITDKTLSLSNPSPGFPIQTVDNIKDSMWSFQFGGGVDIMSFTLDLRYEVGIDNIYTGTKAGSMRNNLLNVSLGFKLL